MRISGNGNARIFFKKHGVTDEQMMSEKKYKHKAAQEYRKHLTKVLNEEQQQHVAVTRSRSEEEVRSGLDALLLKTKEPGLVPETVFALPEASVPQVPVAAPAPPRANGTLDINVAVSKADTAAAPAPTPESSDVQPSASLLETDPMKALKLAGKKPSAAAAKRGLGAKKLVTTTADNRMESFESVEKRSQQGAQEVEQKKKLDVAESSEGGRLSSMLRELDDSNKPSIYRSAPSTTSTSSTSPVYRPSSFASGLSVPTTNTSESYAARQKYGNAKGISSDQYFGRDAEEAADARVKLQNFSNSSAISSDMLYGNSSSGAGSGPYDPYSESATSANAALNLDKLKDSVSGFFSDVQRRFG
eukprot:gene3872-2754_t